MLYMPPSFKMHPCFGELDVFVFLGRCYIKRCRYLDFMNAMFKVLDCWLEKKK